MNLGISKKIIFTSFLFINLLQQGKSFELGKINYIDKSLIVEKDLLETSDNKVKSYLSSNNNSGKIPSKLNSLEKYSDPLLVAFSEKQEEVVIQSKIQSEINDVIYAEGNVSVSYRGKLLKADDLIYDKKNKKISAKGNITLILGDQIFKVSQLEYSFISEKGYLLDVRGSINTNTLIDDLSSKFSSLDLEKIESLLQLKKKEVLHTPGKVENWLFLTDKITINGKKWTSERTVFSNDLLESKQVKLEINSLQVIPVNEKLRFKSSLNYLIFEEKVSIPFWLGDRTLNLNSELDSRWNVGYENLDKDGYFIGRKFNPIYIGDDFVLDLEPQFLIQRSIKGYTKSFVMEGGAITSQKVKRNTSFEDYFALTSQLKGRKNNWDLEIDKRLNSFDFDKFSDAFRLKTKLSKEINFLDSKFVKNIYGIYRERVWNGSLGEAEIYAGYGTNLQKENTWFVDGIKKTEFLSIGLAKIKAEALNSKNLVTNLKGNILYSLDQKFPLSIDDPKYKSVDNSYIYIPEPIIKGFNLNTRLEALYSFYENGDHQEYLGFGVGPELIFGNFQNKTFDYTRLSLLPFYKLKSGESVFKFDHIYDKFTLDIAFDQQLFGPIILKSIGVLNLTSNSQDYGKFIDSKVSLNWKKRSYEFGIFYQPHNQAGGISFSLFGFK